MTSDEFDIFKDLDKPIVHSHDEKTDSKKLTSKELVEAIDSLSHKTPTLLIIDDDLNVRESLGYALEDDYNLLFCASGEEGIEMVNADVDAVILDIKMQGKDGFETYIDIKKQYSHLPIVFHSAYQNIKDPYSVMNEFHPFGYICKEGGAKELSMTLISAVDY